MNRITFSILAIVLLSFTTSAQMRHPAEGAMSTDSSLQKIGQPAGQPGHFGMMERERPHDGGGLYNGKFDKCEPGREASAGYGCGPMCAGMMFHPQHHHFVFLAIFILCGLFFVFVINIILTVLVWLDMTRRRQFSGLWIPVLLLAGIPGTALYALFRIGDVIAAREPKA